VKIAQVIGREDGDGEIASRRGLPEGLLIEQIRHTDQPIPRLPQHPSTALRVFRKR
jgi:hypothetical protein